VTYTYNRSAFAPRNSIIGTFPAIIISDVTHGSHDRLSEYCLLAQIWKPKRQPTTNVKISYFFGVSRTMGSVALLGSPRSCLCYCVYPRKQDRDNYEGHFINNVHYFFLLTRIFYFRQYLFTFLLCSPPASQRPRPNVSEDFLFHLGCHFFQSSDGSGNRCRNLFQGGKTVSTHGLF